MSVLSRAGAPEDSIMRPVLPLEGRALTRNSVFALTMQNVLDLQATRRDL